MQRGREVLTAIDKPIFDAWTKPTRRPPTSSLPILGCRVQLSTDGRPTADVVRSAPDARLIGRRQAYFKDEFLSALEILNRGDLKPEHWSARVRRVRPDAVHADRVKALNAVDFDGDGKRDFATTSAISRRRREQSEEGRLGAGATGATRSGAAELQLQYADRGRDTSRMAAARLPPPGGGSVSAHQRSGLLAGARWRAWARLPDAANSAPSAFHPAEAYALAIGHVDDRLRGGQALRQAGRANERVSPATSGSSCSKLLVAARHSIRATPTVRSDARRATPCSTSRSLSASPPTLSPRPACSAFCWPDGTDATCVLPLGRSIAGLSRLAITPTPTPKPLPARGRGIAKPCGATATQIPANDTIFSPGHFEPLLDRPGKSRPHHARTP